MLCQICFEEPDDGESVTRFCGEACPAILCRACLRRHLQVSLNQFYPGILPKLRCPICLEFITWGQWVPHSTSGVIERYQALCRQACAFYSPCCHNANYIHLPEFDDALVADSEEASEYSARTEAEDRGEVLTLEEKREKREQTALIALRTAEKTASWRFPELCSKFCTFEADAPAVVTAFLERFAVNTKDPEAISIGQIFSRALSGIYDPERRATLLLSFLYKHPATRTRCCDRPVCFNCKRATDHTVCDQNENINESTCVVQCRQCHATLVKVEGCDSVTCLCGFVMNWPDELSYKTYRRRKLYPVDIFDLSHFDHFQDWYRNITPAVSDMVFEISKATFRMLMHSHPALASSLRSVVATYASFLRFRKRIPTLARELQRQVKQFSRRSMMREVLAKPRRKLRVAVNEFIWRRRFRKFQIGLKTELYWAKQRLRIPWESQDLSQVADALAALEQF